MSGVRTKNRRNSAMLKVPVGYPDPALLLDNKLTDSDPVVKLLTVSETARLLTVSVPTVRRLQQRRIIPFVKIGGSVRFDKSDLVSYIERNRIEPIG